MNKLEAKEQFNRMTKELNIKHTFSFDEAWSYVEAKRKLNSYRNSVSELDNKIRTELVGKPGILLNQEDIDKVNPLKHTFVDGAYVREIFNPKGELLITKIHKKNHPYFLMKGDMSILTEDGVKRICAPYWGVTKAGTKRVIFTHEDCVFVTVHVTNSKDLNEIEDEVIAKDYDELDELDTDVLNFIDEIDYKIEEVVR